MTTTHSSRSSTAHPAHSCPALSPSPPLGQRPSCGSGQWQDSPNPDALPSIQILLGISSPRAFSSPFLPPQLLHSGYELCCPCPDPRISQHDSCLLIQAISESAAGLIPAGHRAPSLPWPSHLAQCHPHTTVSWGRQQQTGDFRYEQTTGEAEAPPPSLCPPPVLFPHSIPFPAAFPCCSLLPWDLPSVAFPRSRQP